MKTFAAVFDDDWSVLTAFFPDGWRDMAKELGAYQRLRAFPNVDALLRTLLDHVAEGCSLRDTSVRAEYWGCAPVSDVAIWKRLRASGNWLRWMAEGVMKRFVHRDGFIMPGAGLRLRLIDGSTVQEPGAKGISWRMHYSVEFPSLMCTEVHLTRVNVGESFMRFAVTPGDVFMGDRGFGNANGIGHVVMRGGHVIVRVNLSNISFRDNVGQKITLLEKLRTLQAGEVGDWDVWVPYKGSLIPGRICACKLSAAAQEKAVRKSRRDNGKKGKVKPETLEAARYTIIFTTLDRSVSAETILECYRTRWQIELVFKRLKSLLKLGHLRKKDTESARSWIQAKLLLAFLVDAIQRAQSDFSPWGYPISGGAK